MKQQQPGTIGPNSVHPLLWAMVPLEEKAQKQPTGKLRGKAGRQGCWTSSRARTGIWKVSPGSPGPQTKPLQLWYYSMHTDACRVHECIQLTKAESRLVEKSLWDFILSSPKSKIPTWDSKAGGGSLILSLSSALHLWQTMAWASSSAAEPAACACQEASTNQRSSAAYLGACSSPGPAALILTCAAGITILTGVELALTWHHLTPTALPQGFTGGCEVQREGTFLRTHQVMCKMCSPPAKICCLKYGLSMLLHMNSECENPACPSVP